LVAELAFEKAPVGRRQRCLPSSTVWLTWAVRQHCRTVRGSLFALAVPDKNATAQNFTRN
jgi:hypothetical protein